MTDLKALLERVKAATGPDDDGSNPDWRDRRRELDTDLWSLGHEVVRDGWRQLPYYEPDPEMSWELVPRVTASIDAALALVERVAPDLQEVRLQLGLSNGDYCNASLYLDTFTQEPDEIFIAPARTAPLAILSALLSALIAKEAVSHG